ncbi:hypothetical protein K469DRAFT_718675 [Zopfia rhizophila CBS 207.26]|uniref:Uncharacterized protein n=1 Tax=Zopfia rhizophila CBS 207.26 TaxID=1314779 RepID=A0A6A6ENJ4_9PEZI|nr:hypothetical protein K469DRAFT_718675 [Zopfia rhizophila CBS 207.26]
MREHEDNCPWPKLTADLYNYLLLITPPNTATPSVYLDHYQNIIYPPSNYPNH